MSLAGAPGFGQLPDLAKSAAESSTEPPFPPSASLSTSPLDETLPPLKPEDTPSPRGRFSFRIGPADDWKKSRTAIGTLTDTSSGRTVWSNPLPNDLRPRFAFVSERGEVVTFDDWENYKSPYAVVVYDPSGEVRSQYSTEDIAALLNLPLSTLSHGTRFTRCGWWLQARPGWNQTSRALLLKTADRTLELNVEKGTLRLISKPSSPAPVRR